MLKENDVYQQNRRSMNFEFEGYVSSNPSTVSQQFTYDWSP